MDLSVYWRSFLMIKRLPPFHSSNFLWFNFFHPTIIIIQWLFFLQSIINLSPFSFHVTGKCFCTIISFWSSKFEDDFSPFLPHSFYSFIPFPSCRLTKFFVLYSSFTSNNISFFSAYVIPISPLPLCITYSDDKLVSISIY